MLSLRWGGGGRCGSSACSMPTKPEAAARGSEDTNDRAYDFFYLFPLFLSASRLSSNFVEAPAIFSA